MNSKQFDAGDPALAKFHVGAKDLAAHGGAFAELLGRVEQGDWGAATDEERAQNESVLAAGAGFVTARVELAGEKIVIKAEVKLHWTDVFLEHEYEQARHLWRNA